MNSPIQIIEKFTAAWNQCNFDAVLDTLAEDVLYHNIPMEPMRGKVAVKQFIESFEGLEEVDWQLVNIAQNNNVVLTERIDDFLIKGQRVRVPVMRAFEIENEKIVVWRDYFDLQSFISQMPEQ